MSKQVPREVYEIFQMLGLTDFCAGRSVEGYGYIIPEITITPFESRRNEIFYDVEYSNWVIPEVARPEDIPADAFGIVVLLNSSGAQIGSFESFGHAAVLVGNERIGWTYVSKDQFEGDFPAFAKSKYVVKEFRSFAKFKASAHNHSLKDKYKSHSTSDGTEIDSLNYRVQRDSHGRPIERYDKAHFIPTDSVGNVAALAAAIQSAKKNYTLVFWDCSDVTTQALKAAGKKDGEPDLWDDMEKEDNVKQSPKTKHKRIKERNPDARDIK